MKASVLFGAGWENDSLEVLWRDAGRAFCRLWRDDADGSRYAFIPVSAGAEHPTLESVNRLTHEHELKSYLESSWALRPLELVRERGLTMLVVDYTGGEPLDRMIRDALHVPRSRAVGLHASRRPIGLKEQRQRKLGPADRDRRFPPRRTTSKPIGSKLVVGRLSARFHRRSWPAATRRTRQTATCASSEQTWHSHSCSGSPPPFSQKPAVFGSGKQRRLCRGGQRVMPSIEHRS